MFLCVSGVSVDCLASGVEIVVAVDGDVVTTCTEVSEVNSWSYLCYSSNYTGDNRRKDDSLHCCFDDQVWMRPSRARSDEDEQAATLVL
jgi:hypothetical protein